MIAPEELDDLTLWKAQRGNQLAFRTLVLHYQRPVFALLGRMLSPTTKAGLVEDLAQETFLRVFRALPNFSPAGKARLSTWIITIATRLALDELRKYNPSTIPIEDAIALAGVMRTEERIERRILGQEIEKAVSSLTPDHRAVFLLREFHGLRYDEMAKALQIDIGTVKSRLLRARTILRALLAGLLDE